METTCVIPGVTPRLAELLGKVWHVACHIAGKGIHVQSPGTAPRRRGKAECHALLSLGALGIGRGL